MVNLYLDSAKMQTVLEISFMSGQAEEARKAEILFCVAKCSTFVALCSTRRAAAAQSTEAKVRSGLENANEFANSFCGSRLAYRLSSQDHVLRSQGQPADHRLCPTQPFQNVRKDEEEVGAQHFEPAGS